MRRWWLWAIGGVVVLAGGLLAAVTFIPPAPPYEFLAGQRPVDIPMPKQQLTQMQQMGVHYVFYCFKGNFETIEAKADAELKKKGFTQNMTRAMSPDKLTSYYMKGDMMAAVKSSVSTPGKP